MAPPLLGSCVTCFGSAGRILWRLYRLRSLLPPRQRILDRSAAFQRVTLQVCRENSNMGCGPHGIPQSAVTILDRACKKRSRKENFRLLRASRRQLPPSSSNKYVPAAFKAPSALPPSPKARSSRSDFHYPATRRNSRERTPDPDMLSALLTPQNTIAPVRYVCKPVQRVPWLSRIKQFPDGGFTQSPIWNIDLGVCIVFGKRSGHFHMSLGRLGFGSAIFEAP